MSAYVYSFFCKSWAAISHLPFIADVTKLLIKNISEINLCNKNSKVSSQIILTGMWKMQIFFCPFISSFLKCSKLLTFTTSKDKFDFIMYLVSWYLVDYSTAWILLDNIVWLPTKKKLYLTTVHCNVWLLWNRGKVSWQMSWQSNNEKVIPHFLQHLSCFFSGCVPKTRSNYI